MGYRLCAAMLVDSLPSWYVVLLSHGKYGKAGAGISVHVLTGLARVRNVGEHFGRIPTRRWIGAMRDCHFRRAAGWRNKLGLLMDQQLARLETHTTWGMSGSIQESRGIEKTHVLGGPIRGSFRAHEC